jgi:proton-dependent oligopeptide transporter, POT family
MSTNAANPADRLPPQTKFIVGNEACERFSFYGMRAILTLYMTGALIQMSDADATKIGHLFFSAVYFTPLLGAWIADRWWGRYHTILYVSLIYCLGNLVLALTVGSIPGLCLGLALIALGSGGIKPCVSAFVGDQFGPKQQHLLPKVYGLFYWSINFGSFFAFGLIPTIRENYGYGWAFGVPGLFMLLATVIFWLGTPRYVRVPVAPQRKQAGVLRIWAYALVRWGKRRPGASWLDVALDRFSPDEVEGAKAVAGILMVFATVPLFWGLFDQTSTTWVIQGKNMVAFTVFSFHLNPATWGFLSPVLKLFFSVAKDAPGTFAFTLDAERMQSMNPLLVMILIPIFTGGLYPLLEKLGVQVRPLRRMATGMLLAAVSFLLVGWIQSLMDQAGPQHPLPITLQVIPYLLLTAGEVMLSVTGLEFAFSQAPTSLKSTIMSFWMLTVAVGDFLVALITDLNQKFVKAQGAAQFHFYGLLMFLVAAIFIVCALRYRERTFPQPAEPKA